MAVAATLVPDEAFGGVVLQGHNHTVVEACGAIVVPLALIGHLLIYGQRLDNLFRHPSLNGRATPVRGNQTNGDVEHLVEHTAKEVARSAKLGNRCGRRGFPHTLGVIQRLFRGGAGNGEHTNLGPFVCLGNILSRTLYGLVNKATHGHLHITLAHADPNLTQEDVVQHHLLAIADGDGVGATCVDGCHLNGPLAIFVGSGLVGLVVPRGFDGHLLRRSSLAPQVHLGIALQHHVAANQCGQFDFSLGTKHHQCRSHKKNYSFHTCCLFRFFVVVVPYFSAHTASAIG